MRRDVAVGLSAFALSWVIGCASDEGSGTAGPGVGGSGAKSGTGGSAATSSDGGWAVGGTSASGGVGNAGGNAGACAIASDEAVASPVDIIFAIDQSASMGEEIQGVISNLNTNLSNILTSSGIDYRVIFVAGVTGLPSGPEYFQANAGVNSSDALTLLLWTYDGNYKAPNTCQKQANPAVKWSDKLRYESQKVFIVVSDDDPSTFNCQKASASCTSNCTGCANNCSGYCPNFQCPTYADKPSEWGGADFPTELEKLQPAGMFGTASARKWVFHSIIAVDKSYAPSDPITPLNQICSYNGNTGETSGVEYQKLSTLTGGMRFPSCDTNYSPVFSSIAASIVPLACQFNLASTSLGTPDPSKTNVAIDTGSGPELVLKDDTAPCEGGADGWQFTNGDTAVVLCGAACDKVKNMPGAKVSITVGCDTKIRVE